MTGENFVHLHNHTYYSLLDGLGSPKEMAKEAKAQGFKSLAITDHGTCGGWLAFQKACRGEGIKPILGTECYIVDDMHRKEKDDKRYHLTLLAKNQEGLKNLMHLSTLSETKGKYRKPRIDFELLSKHSSGIICSSGCPASELSYALSEKNAEKSLSVIGKYKEVFGDDYYLEIMSHNYKDNNQQQEAERLLSRATFELSKKLNIKAIVTNDAHYAKKEDADYHDVLLCVQTLGNINNPKRFSFHSDEFYLKSYDEMFKKYGSVPQLLMNTVEISEKIADEDLLKFAPDLLPEFAIPDGYSSQEHYLKELIKDGMRAKGLIDKPEYRERIRFEMGVISRCGYTKYFLILWDIMNFAKTSGIRTGVGRGSAVGSLVLYVLDIVKMDPIRYNLLFERFLNPERISPPDVDVDFDYYRRNEIYDYIYRKYTPENCCKIGTYNSLKSKAAVKSTAKALDIGNDWKTYENLKNKNPNEKIAMPKQSLQLADFLSKKVQIGQNIDTTIEGQLKNNIEFRTEISKYPRLLKSVIRLEGVFSSAGVHAAGIIICKDKIDKYIPLRDAKGQICSQFDGPSVEELGLLKFDLLAIKTLTMLDDTVKMIYDRYKKVVDIDNLNPNDKSVFDLLNGKIKNVDNRGIFQFESDGISKLLRDIRVDSFEDMIVTNALYRPGPLGAKMHEMYADYKHGRKPIHALHPKMETVLKDTYGIICFQEDFMKIAQELASFTKGQSDTLRKAVGKKNMKLLEAQKDLFVNGCVGNGIKKEIAEKIFEQIEFFGGYGFNRSHSCAYAFVAYQCAYLKRYYPLEFMTSLLSSEINNQDKNKKLNKYIGQASAMGIVVKKASINKSSYKFTIEKGIKVDTKEPYEFIRCPITILDGVGAVATDSIIKNKPYKNMEDFLTRVDTSKVSSKVFTALVSSGSMDEWGVSRGDLMSSYEETKERVMKVKKAIKKQEENDKKYGGSLFDSFADEGLSF